jgi:hypothetical protein
MEPDQELAMSNMQLEPGTSTRSSGPSSSGSGALLVVLNVFITFMALVPLLLEWLGWISALGIKYLDGIAILMMMAAFIAQAAIAKAGYIVCTPVLLPAGILLPALLHNSGVRWPVKLALVVAELGAIALLLRTVGRLMLQYQQGHFRGF